MNCLSFLLGFSLTCFCCLGVPVLSPAAAEDSFSREVVKTKSMMILSSRLKKLCQVYNLDYDSVGGTFVGSLPVSISCSGKTVNVTGHLTPDQIIKVHDLDKVRAQMSGVEYIPRKIIKAKNLSFD